ncbi:MAG: hypothetical protein H5T73_07480 [Actinobacteria bacterium]|nr:hypothetical protein [Actinomycetota bacterium]
MTSPLNLALYATDILHGSVPEQEGAVPDMILPTPSRGHVVPHQVLYTPGRGDDAGVSVGKEGAGRARDGKAGPRHVPGGETDPRRAPCETGAGVTYEAARAPLSLFGKGICAKYLQAKPLHDAPPLLANPWRPFPFSNGREIFLPALVRVFDARAENRAVYRLYAAAQAGQWESGTFQRPALEDASMPHRGHPWLGSSDPMAFLRHFLGSFSIPVLAADIFLTLETTRVLSFLAARYRGLAEDLSWFLPRLRTTLEPIDHRCMLWNLFFDLLAPLGGPVGGGYPRELAEASRRAALPGASLRDSLAATLAAYRVLLAWAERAPGEGVSLDLDAAFLADDLLRGPGERAARRGEAGREKGGEGTPPGLEELLRLDFRAMSIPMGAGEFLREDVLGERLGTEEGHDARAGHGAAGREARAEKPGEDEERRVRYPEWDYLSACYRPAWATLYQLRAREGDEDAARRLLERWDEVVQEVTRQFRLLRYQERTWRKKLEWGEEIDIQEAVERTVALRCGLPPSEKLYMEKRRVTREVSALFLVDLSASTSSEIKEGAHAGETVLQVLLASVAIMASALEQLGDRYSICGFSGYGRDRVEFLRLKSFDEPLDAGAWKRLGSLKPMKSTRMGTAVRHAHRLLDSETSSLKLLLLLSDGYPQDHDYGEDRTDREYGLRDTAQALREAEAGHIVPFCVTVDAAGHDYLRRMFPPHGYLVVRSVEDLPRELPKVYLHLRGA